MNRTSPKILLFFTRIYGYRQPIDYHEFPNESVDGSGMGYTQYGETPNMEGGNGASDNL